VHASDATEVNSLGMPAFLQFFCLQSYTKEKTKITTIHKALRCISMIDKYSTFIQ